MPPPWNCGIWGNPQYRFCLENDKGGYISGIFLNGYDALDNLSENYMQYIRSSHHQYIKKGIPTTFKLFAWSHKVGVVLLAEVDIEIETSKEVVFKIIYTDNEGWKLEYILSAEKDFKRTEMMELFGETIY